MAKNNTYLHRKSSGLVEKHRHWEGSPFVVCICVHSQHHIWKPVQNKGVIFLTPPVNLLNLQMLVLFSNTIQVTNSRLYCTSDESKISFILQHSNLKSQSFFKITFYLHVKYFLYSFSCYWKLHVLFKMACKKAFVKLELIHNWLW